MLSCDGVSTRSCSLVANVANIMANYRPIALALTQVAQISSTS